MWKFELRRIRQGDKTTASALYDPAGTHLVCVLEEGKDKRMPPGDYPVTVGPDGYLYAGKTKVDPAANIFCPAWHLVLQDGEYVIAAEGGVDGKTHKDAYLALHTNLAFAVEMGGAMLSVQDDPANGT